MTALTPTGLAPTGLTAQLQAGSGDVTAPVLSNPTGTNTGKYSAIGSVTTNEAGGLLYYITTTSPTATAAAVKAGSSGAVAASGVQDITITGLSAGNTYYNHFLHRDAAGNDSTVASSPAWPTEAEQPPAGVVTIGSITVGGTTASVPFEYSATDATGYQYQLDSGAVQAVTTNPINLTGLTVSTPYSIKVRAVNAGLPGDWSATANFTTSASATASITSEPLKNNLGVTLENKELNYVAVYNATTGALVVRKTGLSTGSDGRFTVSDAALVSGTTYKLDWETSTGERRMPSKAAV